MEKVPSLQVIWEKQVQAAVKIHLYPRGWLMTLMNRSLIFLSKPSILHLTIKYFYVRGSNKRFLALILLMDENGVTTGST